MRLWGWLFILGLLLMGGLGAYLYMALPFLGLPTPWGFWPLYYLVPGAYALGLLVGLLAALALGFSSLKERRAWRFLPGAAEGLLRRLGFASRLVPSFPLREEELSFLEGRLYPEQVVDLKAVWRAFLRSLEEPSGPRGFLLANGTGTGKTYVYGGFIYLLKERGIRPLLVLPGEGLFRQVREVLTSLGLEEGEAYALTTYAKLSPESTPEVLILDEAHLAKAFFLSQRGKRVWQAGKEAAFVLYVTATPWDRPWEARYLEALSLPRLTGDPDFDRFIRRFGVGIREGYGGRKEYYFYGGADELAALHKTLTEGGVLSKRLFRPPPGLVEYEAPRLELSREGEALLKEVGKRLRLEALSTPPEERGILMAFRTLLSRAILEREKLKAAFPLLEGLLKEGWHVLLFLQYWGERRLDLSSKEAIAAYLEEKEETTKGILAPRVARALEGLSLEAVVKLSYT